jgi:hypothetical protein
MRLPLGGGSPTAVATLSGRSPPVLAALGGSGSYRHIYLLSDIHTDYDVNLKSVLQLAENAEGAKESILLLAGDVSGRIGRFEATIEALAHRFGLLFFVPGNHDCWVASDGSEGPDSVKKLKRLDEICERLGVLTTPQRIRMACGADVSICPLLSFHHASFDTEPDVPYLRLPSSRVVVKDFKATRWPAGLPLGSEALAEYVDGWNDRVPGDPAAAQAAGRPGLTPIDSWADVRRRSTGDAKQSRRNFVLSFSHFLPRIELMPEKRYLRYPDLMKSVGSDPLRRRIDELRPDVHCFGHSHFGWDATLDDGVRYLQAPLATPNERERRPRSLAVGSTLPLRVFDGDAEGGFARPWNASWSDYYATTPRTPDDTFPAPWVVEHYSKRAPGRISLVPGGFSAEIAPTYPLAHDD